MKIFGPYHVGNHRHGPHLPPVTYCPVGSAAVALEGLYPRKDRRRGRKHAGFVPDGLSCGADCGTTWPAPFVLSGKPSRPLREDKIAAVANSGELEGALAGDKRFVLDTVEMTGLTIRRWPLGLAVKADATDLAAALERPDGN